MQRRIVVACLGLLSLGTPAVADLAHFEYAFTDVCLKNIPDLSQAPAMFKNGEWYGENPVNVGDYGYEFYGEGTSAYLYKSDPGKNPSCAVVDPEISTLKAEWILELALDKYFSKLWEKTTDDSGQQIWQLFANDTKTVFHINDGPEGGAMIDFEIHG